MVMNVGKTCSMDRDRVRSTYNPVNYVECHVLDSEERLLHSTKGHSTADDSNRYTHVSNRVWQLGSKF
jgi:hypothetical protein